MVKGHLGVLAEVPFPCRVRSLFYGELFHWEPWNLTCISCLFSYGDQEKTVLFSISQGWLVLVKIYLGNSFSSAWIQGLKIPTFSYFCCIGWKNSTIFTRKIIFSVSICPLVELKVENCWKSIAHIGESDDLLGSQVVPILVSSTEWLGAKALEP